MMSHISSINFQKSKDFQVFHNATERPDYAIGGEIICNRKGYEALKIKQEIIANAIESYNATKKAKAPSFKAKSYEWSAVCNIKPDTTMQDLENLAKHFGDKYGFQCYQIAIHRDEGHIDDDGNKVINHHAHLEFITLDKETGKNNYNRQKISPKVLREIQTETAQILQMERGIDKRLSGRERVEPRKYAQMKEQERKALRELKERDKRDKLEIEKEYVVFSNKVHKAISYTFDVLDGALDIDTTKSENYAERLEVISETAEYHRKEQEQILTLKEQKARLEQERKAWIEEKTHTADEYKALRALAQKGKSAETLEAQILALKEAHKAEIQALKQENTELKEQKEAIERNRDELAIKNAELEGKAESYEIRIKTLERKKEEQLEKHKEEIDKLLAQMRELKTENQNLKDKISVSSNKNSDLTNENEKVIPTQHQSQEIDLKADSEPKTKAQILREFSSKCHSPATSYTQETEIETETEFQQRNIRRR